MSGNFKRRRFIRLTCVYGLAGVATVSGLGVLVGCNRKQESEELGAQPHDAISAAQAAADPCNDLTGLSATDLANRKTLEYEKRSTDPARCCQVCGSWQPDGSGGPCGVCTVVKGPVHPLGCCRSWQGG